MTKFQIAKSAVQLHAEENKFQHFALWGDYYNSSDRIYNFISWSGDNLSLFGKSTLQSSSCDINPNSFGCLYTLSPILINTNYLSTVILNPTSSSSKLYKNENLVDENNYEVPLNINKFYVGTKIEGYNKKKDEGHFFNGTISELIIFEDILTQAEIQQIYQGDVQGKNICLS